ncbi:hypothetical protein CC86DRAFT_381329 [Ophiobolus disseminans]|uniref:AA9 family lytic polysaccharide monooxygenase n=1 Tax=Ophiobolus disseminans TaxID=1469910 RepID=A0A6A7A1U4_9PLEO|nr:hypothetical protein CC86DRAFT_381329 [Ophiobolus disseminans]
MKTSIVALALAGAAAAHTTVWNVLVNGKDQGVGNKAGGYIDSPPNNNPITDVTSSAMTCNVAGVKASKSIPVNGGDEITFEWHHNTNDGGDDIIDPSHKGPIMVYASKAGANSWTKLWEDTFDGKTWAVDKLIAGSYTGKRGQHSMKLPVGLAPGDYFLRPEINALHEGDRIGGAQFYMECVHVTVGGSGTVALPAGVSFPGAYKATDAGVNFDIYKGATTYPAIGPKVWTPSSGGAAPAPAPATPSKAPVPAPATPTKAPATTPKPATPAAPAKTTLATVAKPAATPATGAGGATAQKWAQCGGKGFTGATACASGSTCQKQNDYYSQCL